MSDDAKPKRGRGRPPGKSDDPEINFHVSKTLYDYLGWLSRERVLGRNEDEVAKQILTDRLARMRQENYRDEQKP